MEKFQALMEKTLVPFATKLSNNKVLKAISGGFGMLLPIIMVGAIASLLAGLSITPYQDFITANGLKTVFTYVTTYTTNMLSLYAAFAIGKCMAEQLDCEGQSSIIGIASLFVFLLLIPSGVAADGTAVANMIDMTYFGSAGLFSAMILGIVVPAIYAVFIKKNITIKMPDGVPPFVSKGFAGIIPVLCITVLFVVIRQLCALTPFGSFGGMIYGLLKAPLASLSESPLTFGLLVLLCNLLWFFGIHGGMVTMPFIGLVLCMLFVAKSERYKSLGKMAIAPALCGVSEPVVFGMPLMLNVMMFIPMILTPLLSFVLSYAVTSIGLVPVLNGMQLRTGTPVLLSGFLTGGWQAMIWQAVLVALQFAIYFPFFKMLDKQAYADEQAAAKEA